MKREALIVKMRYNFIVRGEMRERVAPPAVLTILPRTRSSPSASAS